MKHLHITGCPRSGTTLLAEMMRTCFCCDGSNEHETSVLNPVPDDAQIWITKLPGELDLLARLMPLDACLHAVYIERDPRAVITSIHSAAAGRYATDYKTWSKCHHGAVALSAGSRFVSLRYEELVCCPDKTQDQLLAAFPWLEKKESFANYHRTASASKESLVAMNGLRQVSTDRVDSWRKHLPRIKEEFVRHPEMVNVLIECGYEPDVSWADVLRDIPFHEHAFWESSPPSLLKRFDRWQRHERKLRRFIRAAERRSTTEQSKPS